MSIDFGDSSSSQNSYEQYDRFKAANRYLDHNVDFTYSLTVPGFESRMLVIPDGTEPPCWINICCWRKSIILCFSWLYRLMFNRATSSENHYQLTKV
jgi:hypothetical protein